MQSLFAIPLLLAAAATSTANVRVESANGDWSTLPQLTQKGYEHLSPKVQIKLFEIAESKQCPSFALNLGRLDFRLGFAVQYDPEGNLSRLVLPKLGCPEAEGVAGGALLEMLQAGAYERSAKSPKGWYQGTLAFSYAGDNARDPAVAAVSTQPGAVRPANADEKVCQKIEVLGSRLTTKRVCMTRAEWDEQKRLDRAEVERAQTQRGCKLEGGC